MPQHFTDICSNTEHSCADSGFTQLKSYPFQWRRMKMFAPRNESETSESQAGALFSLENSREGAKL